MKRRSFILILVILGFLVLSCGQTDKRETKLVDPCTRENQTRSTAACIPHVKRMPDVPDFNVTGYLKRDHYHKDSVDVTVYIVSIIDKHSSYMEGVLVLPSEMIETVVKTTASDKYAIEIVSAAGTSFFAGDEDLWCKFNNGTTLRTELIKNDQIYGEAKAALVNGTNATEVTDAQKITIRAGERGIWYIKNQVCHSNASEVYLVKLIVE